MTIKYWHNGSKNYNFFFIFHIKIDYSSICFRKLYEFSEFGKLDTKLELMSNILLRKIFILFFFSFNNIISILSILSGNKRNSKQLEQGHAAGIRELITCITLDEGRKVNQNNFSSEPGQPFRSQFVLCRLNIGYIKQALNRTSQCNNVDAVRL